LDSGRVKFVETLLQLVLYVAHTRDYPDALPSTGVVFRKLPLCVLKKPFWHGHACWMGAGVFSFGMDIVEVFEQCLDSTFRLDKA
jgi:hypothetical protein